MARSYTMVPSLFLTVMLALQVGGALSFSSRLRSSSPRLAVSSRSINPPTSPSPSKHGFGVLLPLFSSPPDDECTSATSNALNKRRAFLANFAATCLLPTIVASFVDPASVSARGYPIDEGGPLVYGADDIMSPKEHGTTSAPVQEKLRYGVSRSLADKICSFNRVFAEMGGYFEGSTSFEKDVRRIVASTGGPVTFYDSVSGKPLFLAPVNRSVDDFIAESKVHGWPSFRDSEVIWDNVRVLKSSGETVSTAGTHLGHNLPDKNGNRYCINLVSVAGNPA